MIYYVNYCGIYNTVFKSQVLTPILRLKNMGYKIELINFDKNISSDKYTKNLNEVLLSGINIHSFQRFTKGTAIEHFFLNRYIKKIIGVILSNNKEGESIILHCRQPMASYMAVKVKSKLKNYNIKVIADFRGVIIDEFKLIYENKSSNLYKIFIPVLITKLKSIEKNAAEGADYIFCVSEKFKEYIHKNYSVKKEKITVIPTCIDTELFKYDSNLRIQMRKELNIDKKFVVIFSGGLDLWQMPDYMMNFFINLKKKMENAFFIVLTKEKEKMQSYFNQYNICESSYKVMSCDFKDVHKYLCCGDLGLILREENLINRVASPTKFAEFIACHVPVIITKGIGDLEDIINKYEVGMVYDDISLEDIGTKISCMDRESNKFDVLVEEIYSWENNLKKIANIYNSCNNVV